MKTGVIGLGAMGSGMAMNLHRAGYLHAVWNRTAGKARELAAHTGVTCARSPAELASRCELIITCVSRDADVLEVIGALAEGIRPGAVVVDTSTVSATTARRAAAILAERRAAFLDAPVSGGVEGARNGTLSVMAGGAPEVLEAVRAPLQAISGNIVHLGPVGSGQACKAANQIMVAGINQAVTEALAFACAAGLDSDRVIDALAGGAAGNWFLDHRGRTMVAGEYRPGFKLSLHHKDLLICRDMAAELAGVSLPLVEMTLDQYRRLMDAGHGDEDISALYRLKDPARAGKISR